MKIALISPDDIFEDGTAIFWNFADGADLNVEYMCSCVWRMLTSEEFFNIVCNGQVLDIQEDRFFKYCKIFHENNK